MTTPSTAVAAAQDQGTLPLDADASYAARGRRHRKVVVLGGEPRLGRLVDVALRPGNFSVYTAASEADALEAILRDPPDLIALDLDLAQHGRPGSSLALCEQLRALVDIPVIFLSVADDDDSKVRALRCGDDYLTRPFSLAELLARAEAVLRRAHPCVELRGPHYDDGVLTIDFAQHEVRFGGVPVTLTPTEYRLLIILARYPGRLFLHDDLLTRVWDEAYRGDHHLLRLHVANLRKKIEVTPAQPQYIKTRRGLGYVFDPPHAAIVPGASGPASRDTSETQPSPGQTRRWMRPHYLLAVPRRGVLKASLRCQPARSPSVLGWQHESTREGDGSDDLHQRIGSHNAAPAFRRAHQARAAAGVHRSERLPLLHPHRRLSAGTGGARSAPPG